ncbi:MAG TPA: 2OG-Fe(II) oxygenase [Rudaea sp.]|nr:2OG-Fe(II) oxygenase [Rudaea sp.]
MNPTTRLSPEWRDWIAHNLARGCEPKALIADMIRASFDPDFASSAVLGFIKQGSGGAAPAATAYVYETPRLAPGNLISTPDRDIRVTMRVERPVVAFLDNVLSEEECDELVRRSADKLERSTIVDPASGVHEVIPDRTSDGTFFPLNADPFIARLDRRIAALMNMPVDNGEGLQILHYRTGGQYTPHYDYFPPDYPGSGTHIANGGQRVSSLVMYLNDVEEGGATVFPELKLKVGPKKGGAVYFEYCNSKNQVDPLTLHGGMPVLKGEKWIATKWMRQRRYALAPTATA